MTRPILIQGSEHGDITKLDMLKVPRRGVSDLRQIRAAFDKSPKINLKGIKKQFTSNREVYNKSSRIIEDIRNEL